MAVPTITGISPSTGPAEGGLIVTITGTDFAIHAVPDVHPAEDVAPGVTVTFGGWAVDWVQVRSATQIVCKLGPYHGPVRSGIPPVVLDVYPAVDVVVQNLDVTGTPVVGEVATAASGFTYRRRDLGPSTEQDRPRGVRAKFTDAVLDELRRRVCKNISMGRSSEYAEGSEATVKLAGLPGVGCVFKWVPDPDYVQLTAGYEEVEDPSDSTVVHSFKGLRVKRLEATLLLGANSSTEMDELCELLEDMIEDQEALVVDANPTLYPGLQDDYNWHFGPGGEPTPNQRGADLDACSGRAVIWVRGILMMSEHSDADDKRILTIEQQWANMDGETYDTELV
jgi:hypothetical protein